MKITIRGAPPAVRIRVFGCPDCGHQLEVSWPGNQEPPPPPDCPVCEGATSQQVTAPHIANAPLTAAVRIAEDMMLNDYGLTDMNDHVRPGDIVAKGPKPMQTAERQAVQQEIAEMAGPAAAEALSPGIEKAIKNFWQPSGREQTALPPNAPAPPAPVAGQAQATAAKTDGLSVLEAAKTSGRMRHRIVAQSDMKP